MKVLCMADQQGVELPALQEATKMFFGDRVDAAFEIVEYPPDTLFIYETEGLSAVEPPKGFFNHTDAEVIIGGIICPFSKETIEMFPNLRVIGTCRGGLENVDMDTCKKREIMVVNGYGRNAEAVSDFTIGLMLAELRNIARCYRLLTEDPDNDAWRNDWVNTEYIPHIKETKIGIYGFGYIGRLVAKKLAAFGGEILIYDPFVSDEDIKKLGYIPVDSDTLFKESDIVSIHSRLVEATKGIIGKREIDMMKPIATFVNTARAGLVDYDALLDALQNKRIGGAALDVFPTEPLPPGSPWRKLDNCTVVGHMAGGVLAARPYAAKLVAESIVKAMKNEDVPQIITKDIMSNERFKEWASMALSDLEI